MFISTLLREDDRTVLLEHYKTITAIKPERSPPRMFTDTVEGIHPMSARVSLSSYERDK